MKKPGHVRSLIALALALAGALLPAGPAGGVVLTEESFDEPTYATWLTCDGRHENAPGWSGNAAKFWPPYAGGPVDNCEDSYQGYAGVSEIDWPGEPTRINIRMLVLFGPSFPDHATVEGSKMLILQRGYGDTPAVDDGVLRFMLLLHSSVRGWELEIAQNIGNVAATDDLFLDLADRLGEWLCVELEVDLPGNYYRMYLTTTDGVYNETVYIHAEGDDSGCPYAPCFHWPDSFWGYISVIGGFWGGMSIDDPDSYVMFDELVVADEYIGPPDGFVGGTPPACTFTLSSTSAAFPAAGGTGEVEVGVGPAGCSPASWTASSDGGFVTVTSGSSGAGNGTVTYDVAQNTGEARSAVLTIAGLSHTVSQEAAGSSDGADEDVDDDAATDAADPAPEGGDASDAGPETLPDGAEPAGDGGDGCSCTMLR